MKYEFFILAKSYTKILIMVVYINSLFLILSCDNHSYDCTLNYPFPGVKFKHMFFLKIKSIGFISLYKLHQRYGGAIFDENNISIISLPTFIDTLHIRVQDFSIREHTITQRSYYVIALELKGKISENAKTEDNAIIILSMLYRYFKPICIDTSKIKINDSINIRNS